MVLVRLGLVLALCVGWVAAPAGAQQRMAPDDEVVVEAVVALEAEILVLVELGALDAVPPQLDAVHHTWVEYTDGFTRDGLLQWLYEADASGVRALELLIEAGFRPSSAIRAALGPIGSGDRVVLEAGGTIGIAPVGYAEALAELEALLGLTDSTPAEDSSGSLAPARATRSPVLTDTAAADPGRDGVAAASVEEYPWSAVSIALAAVVAAGAAMILVSRRHRRRGAAGSSVFDHLLDAGRRMAGALNLVEIAEIAVSEATTLGRARLGAFVRVAGGELTLVHETAAFVDARCLDAGVLSRVAATGRSIRLISNDEPSLTSLPAAILAVPVIGMGSVSGILVLVRSDDAPFTHHDEDLIGRLAPMVGSALVAAEAHGDVAHLARIDPLTGLGNRRSLDADLASALLEVPSVGTVMVDVDHFKHFNDTNGHAAGDVALQAVADVLRAGVRAGDAAYRYGGEEFSLILRNVTTEQVLDVAERIRSAVEQIDVTGADRQPGGHLTVSIGAAIVTEGTVDSAIDAADAALYEAKAAGRNRTVIAAPHVSVV